jgi:hypothetical protein
MGDALRIAGRRLVSVHMTAFPTFGLYTATISHDTEKLTGDFQKVRRELNSSEYDALIKNMQERGFVEIQSNGYFRVFAPPDIAKIVRKGQGNAQP